MQTLLYVVNNKEKIKEFKQIDFDISNEVENFSRDIIDLHATPGLFSRDYDLYQIEKSKSAVTIHLQKKDNSVECIIIVPFDYVNLKEV